MRNKKYILLVLLFLVCILSISAISAADNTTKQDVISADNNKESNVETFNQYDDVSNSKENVELKEEENNNNDKVSVSKTDKTTTDNAELTFTDLNTTINGNTNSTIYLSNNYKYNSTSDSRFSNGISISRNLNVYGNGVTINGNNIAGVFKVTDRNLNVNFYNINFINAKPTMDGALFGGNAYNCTFTNNKLGLNRGNAYNCTFTNNNMAMGYGNAYNCTFINNSASAVGGALFGGNAYNCIFINNTAKNGGAIHRGNATLCIFNGNTAENGGAMCNGNATLCAFNSDTITNVTIIPVSLNVLNYTSPPGERLKFNLTANGILLNGVNTTIKIYKNDGSLVKTVYALTGEGWVVDLDFGTYTAVLSLTAYPEEKAVNATITVAKGNTYIIINPIDAKIGQELKINYTTNSNGTVTIKINGTPITDGKFTPPALGTYNLTIEIAENDYYTAGYNETTFTAERTNTTIVINPIADVHVGDEVLINYTINSNGTVTIKVNGDVIADGKFTPTKEGVYNITIEVAENDYYTAGYNETTFTAERTNTTVVINPIADVLVGEEVLINYTINSNGTVTIKVNGTPINGAKFTPTKEGIYNITIEVAENDYYAAGYNETTFTAERTNTTVVINPIIDAKAGKEIIINYTTNSNGTVTIKVNGDVIADGKFTPPTNGTYNVTIEVAENDYYAAGYNETTFTAERTNTTVVINPIIDAKAGKEIIINYTTNSNGTVTIKVNGDVIADGKFTPPTNGTYNVTIEVAENDYYTAATNETTFKVKKMASTIIANPVTTNYNLDKYLTITLKDEEGKPITGEVLTVKILGISKKYTTDANGQVKIKVSTLGPKTYQARIKYEGSNQFKVSATSVNVTVKKATPKITAKSARFKMKTLPKKYTITLKNQNKVIKNKKVTLKVKGKTYTSKTNSKGQATFKIRNLNKKGTYNAVITATGNYYYNQVSKKVKINVKP